MICHFSNNNKSEAWKERLKSIIIKLPKTVDTKLTLYYRKDVLLTRNLSVQARWNGLKVGWDIPIKVGIIHLFRPGWNRVKVAAKRLLGRIPTVPQCSGGPGAVM